MKTDGVGIAWQNKVFEKCDEDHVNFDDLVSIYDERFKKDNHAQFILFKHLETNTFLVVGNCHLHYDPNFDYVKHAQALHLMKRAAAFIQKHGD